MAHLGKGRVGRGQAGQATLGHLRGASRGHHLCPPQATSSPGMGPCLSALQTQQLGQEQWMVSAGKYLLN